MKQIIFLLFISLFLGFFSCQNNNSGEGNKEISEIKALSGISLITEKNGYYNIYCTKNIVSYSIDNKKYDYELKEDKQIENYELGKLKFIKIKPFLVITYDDCPSQDWNAYEIHKSYTPIVPAEIGINLHGHALSTKKIEQMVNEGGWEVSNHGYTHTRMEAVSIQNFHNAGSDKIYGWFAHTFIDSNEILIGEDIYKILSHGSDSNGQYFTVEPNLQKDYKKGTKVRISNKQLEMELTGGVSEFEKETGIKIDNFIYPYTVYDERTVSEISKYYSSVRAYNGYINNVKNLENPGFNEFPFENKYFLNSANYICYYNELEIDGILAKIKKNNYMAIQFAHTWASDFRLEKLKYLIDKANELGIEITTRSKIWKYYEL